MPADPQTPTGEFDPRSYWEDRLAAEWTLTGVGLRRLGARFNTWAYRIRRDVFLDTVRAAVPDLAHARVLDVGTGTGFYVDRWREAGAAEVSGLDLTQAAVDRLRERYPTLELYRADIGAAPTPELEALAGRYDAISVMDVMFHIVDDDAFARALANLRTLLRPGGVLVWSDVFAHHPQARVEHRVSRSLADATAAVGAAGFEVVRRRPLFVLMNELVDTRTAWPRTFWKMGMGVASLAEPLGGLAGWALYPLESRLVRRRTESPSTEIMVCRAV